MESRNILGFALLVLTGVAYNTTATREPQPSPSRAGGSRLTPGHGPGEPSPLWTSPEGFATAQCSSSQDNRDILLAVLPDPLKTHLGLYFDRGIESIERAAGDAGYSFANYWLPWRENPYRFRGPKGSGT